MWQRAWDDERRGPWRAAEYAAVGCSTPRLHWQWWWHQHLVLQPLLLLLLRQLGLRYHYCHTRLRLLRLAQQCSVNWLMLA
jgi:hypothetical protein